MANIEILNERYKLLNEEMEIVEPTRVGFREKFYNLFKKKKLEEPEEDAELKELKELIQNQENQRKLREISPNNSISSDYSSDLNNETKLNTDINKLIHLNNHDINIKDEASKIFLKIYKNEENLINSEKFIINLNDYKFDFDWYISNNDDTKIKFNTKLEFNEIIVQFKLNFKKNKSFQINLFKSEYELIHSKTVIAIKIINDFYKIFKIFLRIFIDNNYLKNNDLIVLKLRNLIIGLNFKFTNNQLLIKLYSKDICNPLEVVDFLKKFLPIDLNLIENSKFYNTDDYIPKYIYKQYIYVAILFFSKLD